MPKFNLGDSAKDIVTGFTGICIARFEWLNGCVRYDLQPAKLKDGLPLDSKAFDEGQLVLVKRAAVVIPPRHTGGPMATPRMPAGPRS
jgi:hypothetical protein